MRRGFGIHDRHSPFRFDPATLFIGGAIEGAFYDPGDLTTLFQDSVGTTPVTASGQPVGLMLDKSKGLVLGSELVTNGDFSQGTTGWTTVGNITIGSGVAAFTGGTTSTLYQAGWNLTSGRWYRVRFTVVSGNTPATLSVYFGSTNQILVGILAPGNFEVYGISSGDNIFYIQGASNVVLSLDNISVRELPGNHAYQTSSGSRPLWQQSSGLSYLAFDGSNDSMLTGSIDFTGTNKMTLWAGVTKLSDATRGMVAEFGNNAANGFQLNAPSLDPATYSFASRGSLFPGQTVGSPYAAPNTSVLTGIGDIAADVSTLRVNGAAFTNSADQGTGNYSNQVLYIGSRAGTSLPFNGRLYGLIVLGAAASSWQIQVTEQWMAGKTGITI